MSLYDLVRMDVASAPGLGAITLGAAVDGGRSFAAAGVPDGQTVEYAVEDGANREQRRGVYTVSGTSLSRGTLLASTTGAAISLTSAAKVFITPASDELNDAIANRTLSDTRSGAYTLVAANAGRRQRVNGNVTVDNSVFAAGDIVMLHSYSASLIDVIQGSGVTLRIGGSTVTGTCKLGPHGVAILVFDSASDCTIQGAVM